MFKMFKMCMTHTHTPLLFLFEEVFERVHQPPVSTRGRQLANHDTLSGLSSVIRLTAIVRKFVEGSPQPNIAAQYSSTTTLVRKYSSTYIAKGNQGSYTAVAFTAASLILCLRVAPFNPVQKISAGHHHEQLRDSSLGTHGLLTPCARPSKAPFAAQRQGCW